MTNTINLTESESFTSLSQSYPKKYPKILFLVFLSKPKKSGNAFNNVVL